MATAKLKNINLRNPYLLNAPAKFTIAGLVVAGVLAVGYFGVFKGQLETLSSEEIKEVELKKAYTKRSIKATSLANLQAELSSIRSAFDILLKQLPTDAGVPTLIQKLHQAGATNGLGLDSVLPQAPVNDEPIQRLPYEIAITGKYNQISQFTRDVGKLSRITTLESLKIDQASANKDREDDLLTLSATVTTYKARPAEEVATELAASTAGNGNAAAGASENKEQQQNILGKS